MFELGKHYKLIEKDSTKAIKYYMMAYIHGHPYPKIIRDIIMKELKEYGKLLMMVLKVL